MLRPRGVTPAIVVLATTVAVAARAEDLLVFAAASLTDALGAVGRRYEAEHGSRVSFHFASSNHLARQIRAGAPADVFFSADAGLMDDLAAAGLVSAAARRDPIGNSLVVIVPREAGDPPRSAVDLLKLDRLALGDPDTVPVGRYARRYLEAAGVWPRLLSAIVPLRDVRAVLAAVGAGHAPAGIVYRTDASYDDRVRVAFAVPVAGLPRIRYSVAPVEGASPAAAQVARFLASEASLGIFERYGFERIE